MSEALCATVPGALVTHSGIEDVMQGTATKGRVRVMHNDVGRVAGLPPTLIVKGGFSAHRTMMS